MQAGNEPGLSSAALSHDLGLQAVECYLALPEGLMEGRHVVQQSGKRASSAGAPTSSGVDDLRASLVHPVTARGRGAISALTPPFCRTCSSCSTGLWLSL